MKLTASHYDEKYFEWQRSVGIMAGHANRFIYEPFIGPDDVVLDFGCGGGYMLAQINCRRRIGVEINQAARSVAQAQGLEVHENVRSLGSDFVDVIISNHALEHSLDPLQELINLRASLRPGGRLVLVTPFERNSPWRPGDINQHLFTWSPMNLGNLVTRAGMRIESVEVIHHRFPPRAQTLRQLFGAKVFHCICLIWGRIYTSVTQVRVVAINDVAAVR
jgi:SAM-dependent methyltransferase